MATLPETVESAILREVEVDSDGTLTRFEGDGLPELKVQFNPETLKVGYQVKKANEDQAKGSPFQFTGPGNTKLSVDLIFDTTVDAPKPSSELIEGDGDHTGSVSDNERVKDVRVLTRAVNYFLRAKERSEDGNRYSLPHIGFLWGSFFFYGIMDSMNETLEFFSAEGLPLRASVSISITQQKVDPEIRDGMAGAGTGGLRSRTPDLEAFAEQNTPQVESKAGDTVQDAAARATGDPRNWRDLAEANDIDNPRNLAPGTTLTMPSVRQSGSASPGLGAGASFSGSASPNAGTGFDDAFNSEL